MPQRLMGAVGSRYFFVMLDVCSIEREKGSMYRVHIVCCLSRRFCSSDARPNQYGSEDEADVRGTVDCAIMEDFRVRL